MLQSGPHWMPFGKYMFACCRSSHSVNMLLAATAEQMTVCPSMTCVFWNTNFAMQTPPKQLLPCGQAIPHAVQLLLPDVTSISQPLAGLLSQSPQPARQPSITHMLFTHLLFALGKLHCGQVHEL